MMFGTSQIKREQWGYFRGREFRGLPGEPNLSLARHAQEKQDRALAPWFLCRINTSFSQGMKEIYCL